jgi:hypothetical protein
MRVALGTPTLPRDALPGPILLVVGHHDDDPNRDEPAIVGPAGAMQRPTRRHVPNAR